jgi:hypothetical protein
MPNGADKKLNFVAKVYDPTAKEFKPIYIAPDATDKVQGDVKLSDATNSTLNAAEGMTAATPAAVKSVQDNANNKLDKTTTSAQTVKSAVTFSGLVTGSAGFKGNLTGNVTGNADTATALKTARTISVKSGNQSAGSATFNGTGNVTITIPTIDGTTIRGIIPLASIPQGALDRVVSYASISAAVSAWTSAAEGSKPFDIGDTIRVTGTTPNVMYAVTAEPSKTASYVEYAAGTATNAIHADEADTADQLTTARTIRTNLASTSAASFNGTANITPGVTGTLPIANGGTGATTALAANNAILASTVEVSADWNDNTMIAYISSVPNATQGALRKYSAINVWSHWLNPKIAASYATKSHTHANATTSAAGFLPKLSGSTTQYLRGDGTWATVQAGVTGVKGNAETSYRTGNVNLTPANIGAAAASHTHNYLPLGGGTLTGNLSSRQIAPSANNSYTLGTSSLKWSNVYATTFTGNLTGNASTATTATNATTASKVNQTLTLSGDVTGSVSLNATGTRTMTTNIAASTVGFAELKSEVGTVYVGSTTPTDDSVKLWVKI